MIAIEQNVQELGAKDSGPRRVKSNTASSMGHPCIRHLIYLRTAWDKAAPTNVGLAGVYQTGNELEPLIERILSAAGQAASPRWRIVGSQQELRSELLEEVDISGHPDGIIQVETAGQDDVVHEALIWKNYGVGDIKTASPNVFNNLHDYDSLKKYFWTEGYKSQLSIYAKGTNQKRCVLIFVNKANLFEVKLIEWDLDEKLVEELLAKARKVNDHIRTKTLPDKINRPDICGRCKFAALCLPELEATEGVTIVADDDLSELLDRWAELEPAKKEFDGLDRKLKKQLVGGKDIVCGNHMVKWTHVQKKGFTVAATEYWTKKVTSLQVKDNSNGE